MTRKKRKRGSLRRQTKQQRRAARARKRRERNKKPRRTPSARLGDEVIADMLPLLQASGDASSLSASDIDELMMGVLDSEDMANEPELEGIIIDPMLCVDTFVEIGQEMGIDPEALAESPEEEREEIQMQMLEETMRRLLTEELRQEILEGVNALRLRLKQSSKREEAAKVAVLQSFLSEEEGNEIWSTIGLVQAIVQRSLVAGFELLELSIEAMEPEGVDEEEFSLLERLGQSSLVQKADALLSRIPGMRWFLEKQADKIWEEGMEAIHAGELCLGLYTLEELEGGVGIFAEVIGHVRDTGMASEETSAPKEPEELQKALILGLNDYVAELFTPQRLDQLRGRLNIVLREVAHEKKWLSFILMLIECMEDEDAAKNERGFLISALLGEIKAAARATVEDDE